MRPEVAAVCHFLGTLDRQSLLKTLSACPDWPTLIRGSDPEGLTPLVASVIASTRGPHCDPSKRLAKGQFLTQGRYQQFVLELAKILRNSKIQGLLLKGAGLLQTVYVQHPGIRPLGDIDLLIRPSDFTTLDSVLRSEGFEVRQPMLYQRGEHWVDLHLDLLNNHFLPSRSLAFHLRVEEFMAAAIPLPGALQGLLVPNPVDQFLHLSVHALKHSHGRLFWLVDLALVLPCCPWQVLQERARQTNTTRPLYYSLELLQAIFGLEVPQHGARLHPAEKWYLRKVVTRPAVNIWGEVVTCLSIPGLRGQMRYLYEFLRPKQRFMAYWRGLWPR